MIRIDQMHGHKIFKSEDEARSMVDAIKAGAPDDPDEYIVVVDPAGSGRAIIAIRDEDGNELGYL